MDMGGRRRAASDSGTEVVDVNRGAGNGDGEVGIVVKDLMG